MVFMTPVVLKNFLSQPATRLYPAEAREPFAGSRGKLWNSVATCILCGMCAKKCPSQCITVRRKDELWEYDPFACVFCGICTESCPTGSLQQLEERREVADHREKVVLKVHVDRTKDKK